MTFLLNKLIPFFFKSLQDRGYDLTFSLADNPELVLVEYGEYLYDYLIIFAPSVEEFGGLIDVPSILGFIDSGHDVLIAASSQLSDPIREIASECGVDFAEEKTFVMDHLNFDVTDYNGEHTLIVADHFVNAPIILGSAKIAPVLFRGVGLALNEDNSLLISILSGSSTSYSYSPTEAVKENPHTMGHNTQLIAALQARNNARVTFSGSLELFSDKFYLSSVQKYSSDGKTTERFEKSGNEQFVTELTKWTFKERGVLQSSNVVHKNIGTNETNPGVYRINDIMEYSVQIQEWDGKKWKPYKADDVKLEFVRLSPLVRKPLRDKNGIFSTQFRVPDVYGVFQLKVQYQRLGYTFLSNIDKVTVRPLRHSEYERYIEMAYPYYASVFSMMGGFLLFSFVFLYYKPHTKKPTVDPTSSQ